MKYELLASFHNDYRRLPERERALFREAVRQMNQAVARHAGSGLPRWPGSLRVRAVTGAPGIWEMTWSFAGPDGCATFEYVLIDGEPGIR